MLIKLLQNRVFSSTELKTDRVYQLFRGKCGNEEHILRRCVIQSQADDKQVSLKRKDTNLSNKVCKLSLHRTLPQVPLSEHLDCKPQS